MKFADGGVVETSRMFHAASCALNRPARRPTRGSGLGGRMTLEGAGPLSIYEDDCDDAQAPTPVMPAASSSAPKREGIIRFIWGPGVSLGLRKSQQHQTH